MRTSLTPEEDNTEIIVTSSWDDGSISDLKLLELLEVYSIRATFYITKCYKYLEDPLSEEDIIELSRKNEIGAHTLTHPDLDRISLDQARIEIVGSKDYLENIISYPVKSFCYPRGKYNYEIAKIVKEAGFESARTCNHGIIGPSANPFAMPITLHASNGSPYLTFKICRINRLSYKSLTNWGIRAKKLFDSVCLNGGIYHIWGHSSEIEADKEWKKLESVLDYISNRSNVKYLANSDLFEYIKQKNNKNLYEEYSRRF